MKRLVREMFRQLQPQIPALDLVVRVRKPFAPVTGGAARAELARHFKELRHVPLARAIDSRISIPDQPASGPKLPL